MSIHLEDPVTMCSTYENYYWTHGHVDKTKFRGELLSRSSTWSSLEGEESPQDIIAGKVKHGWVITVIGDTSGCGWDMTMYFREEKPEVVDGHWTGETVLVYDDDDNESEDFPEVADGPHEATWWEP